MAVLPSQVNMAVDETSGDIDVMQFSAGTRNLKVSLESAPVTVTVEATDLDIRDLDHTQDSVKVGDGTNFIAVNADGSLNVVEGASATGAYGTVTVTNAATLIRAANSSRKRISVQNLGAQHIFLGFDASVTTSNGIQVLKFSEWDDTNYTGAVYGITASSTSDIRYQEIG